MPGLLRQLHTLPENEAATSVSTTAHASPVIILLHSETRRQKIDIAVPATAALIIYHSALIHALVQMEPAAYGPNQRRWKPPRQLQLLVFRYSKIYSPALLKYTLRKKTQPPSQSHTYPALLWYIRFHAIHLHEGAHRDLLGGN